MDIIERARIFAIAAHSATDQRRKYTNEPYWVHPEEVAALTSQIPGSTKEMIAAAYLHDVVEDTKITNQLISDEFGQTVGELVGWLTNISTPEMGNRARRKEIDKNFLAQAPAEAQSIKCADLRSNTQSIAYHDPRFAKIYLEEKKALLEVMTKAHPDALKMAYDALSEAEQFLNSSVWYD